MQPGGGPDDGPPITLPAIPGPELPSDGEVPPGGDPQPAEPDGPPITLPTIPGPGLPPATFDEWLTAVDWYLTLLIWLGDLLLGPIEPEPITWW